MNWNVQRWKKIAGWVAVIITFVVAEPFIPAPNITFGIGGIGISVWVVLMGAALLEAFSLL